MSDKENENQENNIDSNKFEKMSYLLNFSMITSYITYICMIIAIFNRTGSIIWTIVWAFLAKIVAEFVGLITSGNLKYFFNPDNENEDEKSSSNKLNEMYTYFRSNDKFMIDFNTGVSLFQGIIAVLI